MLTKFRTGLRVLRNKLQPVDQVSIVVTVLGINVLAALQLIWPDDGFLQVIILSVLSVLIIVYLVGRFEPTDEYDFQVGSKKEADFFAKWYEGQGRLVIFCSDLEWLKGVKYASVIYALEAKGKDLTIYLKRLDGVLTREHCASLKNRGAQIKQVPHWLKSEHRFSILLDDGFDAIIIRNKKLEDGRVRVVSFQDNPQLVHVSLDMLDASHLYLNLHRKKSKRRKLIAG